MEKLPLLAKQVELIMKRKAISRAELCLSAKIKKETLEAMLNATRKSRSVTIRNVAGALGVMPEELIGPISDSNSDMDQDSKVTIESNSEKLAILEKIVLDFGGLPLLVAQSIVAAFEGDSNETSPLQLEKILRAKAEEYHSLRRQLQEIVSDNPEIVKMRQDAVSAIDAGQFDLAESYLRLVREKIRMVRLKIEAAVDQKKISEFDTLLSLSTLLSLKSQYASSLESFLEAHDLIAHVDQSRANKALVSAARLLNQQCQDQGEAASLDRNAEFLEKEVLPRTTEAEVICRTEVLYNLADLYALSGYRRANTSLMFKAIRTFRRICSESGMKTVPEIMFLVQVGLGDAHVELGLNKGNVRQMNLGLAVMRDAFVRAKGIITSLVEANGRIRLGTALANLGLVTDDPADFLAAESSYLDSIRSCTGPADKLMIARAHWGISIALTSFGRITRDVDALKRSISACNSAIETIVHDRYPIDWATIVTNRGNALLELGILENGDESLRAAVADYDKALTVRTKERFPLGFSKTIGNRGRATLNLAKRSQKLELAESAALDLEIALKELPKDAEKFWRNIFEIEYSEAKSFIQTIAV
jgi:hypothetical protein